MVSCLSSMQIQRFAMIATTSGTFSKTDSAFVDGMGKAMFNYIFVTMGYAEDQLGGVVGFRYLGPGHGFDDKNEARKSLCETIFRVYSEESNHDLEPTRDNHDYFRKWMENIMVGSAGCPLAFFANDVVDNITWAPYWYLPDDMSQAFSYDQDDAAGSIFNEICKLNKEIPNGKE